MANTYASLQYHIVFSTKNRAQLISRDIGDRVSAYIGGNLPNPPNPRSTKHPR
jgi:REP element-mobilizing transposase RayT